jgi:hypothetical protein
MPKGIALLPDSLGVVKVVTVTPPAPKVVSKVPAVLLVANADVVPIVRPNAMSPVNVCRVIFVIVSPSPFHYVDQ